MLGNMMQTPLLISSILQQAAVLAPAQEIVSRRHEGDIHRYSYRECYQRSCRLAHALQRLGVKSGDRVATLALNGYRHVELYYAISGIGAIAHTINPRLFSEQIEYIVRHADDTLLFADLSSVPLLNDLHRRLPSLRNIVLLCDEEHVPADAAFDFICYEPLLATEAETFEWPAFDENSAAALCYTSGTTGHPKGVLYSHRSTVLHALATCTPNLLNLSYATVALPVVPMYHVAAWGLPYSALMTGAKLVLPGPATDGAALHELITQEAVTLALGVPTVWLTLLHYLEREQLSLPAGLTLAVGGAATPPAIVEAYREQGVYVMPLWGMTETSPVSSAAPLVPSMATLTPGQRTAIQTSAGRGTYGTELAIFGPDGTPLPHDGTTSGELHVRGPWVVERYFRSETSALAADASARHGWFDTGDVATLDPHGYLRIVDRSKDVIKSGGEWISSIELENAALSHPSVREACVVGVPHPKWDERPLLLVVMEPDSTLDKAAIRTHLASRVAKWWLPDDIVATDELPHTATGKLHKLPLREAYRDHYRDAAKQDD